MIDESEVKALKNTILCDVHEHKWLEVLDTLEALYKVVRAAQKVKFQWCESGEWEELTEALAPFRQEQEEK